MKNFTNIKIDEQFVGATVSGSTPFDVSNDNIVIFPGFCDVHVHFREPGFSYKETIKTGSLSGANGGYTDVCTMPNLDPVPDSVENIQMQIDIIKRDAVIGVHPYASITVNQDGSVLSDLEGMKDLCIAFSDDGRGVQSDELMEKAMIKAKELGKMIVAHCEVNSLLHGGYIHDGEFCALHGMKGICSESEWQQVKRDLELVKKTGCSYHVCHISTKETVELIRRAKKEGLDVTCETGPHYLVYNDMDIKDEGRFKMNPPIRSEADRQALVQGILDGTIDMIATDHAPHSLEEKSLGCIEKAGSSDIVDVLGYGERLDDTQNEGGVYALNAPGNDLIAATALAASGAQIVLFTTGRGTPFSTFTPTMKISTNNRLAEKKNNWIDFNAYGMDEEGLFELLLKTVNGEYKCKSEDVREIAFYKTGVTL